MVRGEEGGEKGGKRKGEEIIEIIEIPRFGVPKPPNPGI